jgi:hypothetical protein
MLSRVAQTVLLPPAVIGGFFVAEGIGGFVQDIWDDFLAGFLIAYWIGLGFLYAWDQVREAVKGARPGIVAATVGAVLLVLVIMVGPVSLLDDPGYSASSSRPASSWRCRTCDSARRPATPIFRATALRMANDRTPTLETEHAIT